MTWHDFAACKGATAVFFPPKGGLHTAHIARAICAGCPVAEPCLEEALSSNTQHGIWAGHTVKELRVIRRQRREDAA